jgi:poly(A) polymerase
VAPRHIDRERHFFGVLGKILKDHPDVSEISEVREAFVPIIKMTFLGIDIDLLFARVAEGQVGDNLTSLDDDNILRNCDPMTIRSLNGCRVTDLILTLIPN